VDGKNQTEHRPSRYIASARSVGCCFAQLHQGCQRAGLRSLAEPDICGPQSLIYRRHNLRIKVIMCKP